LHDGFELLEIHGAWIRLSEQIFGTRFQRGVLLNIARQSTKQANISHPVYRDKIALRTL
jgi:hypothetical protein